MQKMEWFGVVREHSMSTAMSPFDRAHTTSYLTLIETMCLSFTVFTARRGHRMQVGWVKIGDFRRITGFISKTVRSLGDS